MDVSGLRWIQLFWLNKPEWFGLDKDSIWDAIIPNNEVPRQVKVQENQGFWAPIIVRTATKVQQFLYE